jgi:hypothetical protein
MSSFVASLNHSRGAVIRIQLCYCAWTHSSRRCNPLRTPANPLRIAKRSRPLIRNNMPTGNTAWPCGVHCNWAELLTPALLDNCTAGLRALHCFVTSDFSQCCTSTPAQPRDSFKTCLMQVLTPTHKASCWLFLRFCRHIAFEMPVRTW